MSQNHKPSNEPGQTTSQTWRLGAVSYLNARPLVCGLDQDRHVHLELDVPARLAPRLEAGEFDAALVPVIELLRPNRRWRILSDACIAANGETLTVRVFSRVPPHSIQRLWVDAHSRSSVTLARVLWPHLYNRDLEVVELPEGHSLTEREAVLLIGDKVVGVDPTAYRYQVDLGGAWRTWTGLPFVFAVWAGPLDTDPALGRRLSRARDAGCKRLANLAVHHGPALGWPVELAQEYLERYIRYALTDKYVEGLVRFLDLAAGLPGPTAEICGAPDPVA